MMRRAIHPLLIALAFAASALAWGRLPERVPVHWNLQGEVDRYGGRLEGALILPVVMLAIWGMMRVLPKADPKRANYARMQATYELVITLTLAGMLAMHLAVVAVSLGYEVPIGRVIPFVVGMMLIAIGNVLPRAKPNWWFGVRTPWTLSSERVWVRTHRVAGYSLALAGLTLVIAGFVTATWARILMVAGAVIGGVVPVVYSYFAWRKESST